MLGKCQWGGTSVLPRIQDSDLASGGIGGSYHRYRAVYGDERDKSSP